MKPSKKPRRWRIVEVSRGGSRHFLVQERHLFFFWRTHYQHNPDSWESGGMMERRFLAKEYATAYIDALLKNTARTIVTYHPYPEQ